MQPDRLCSSGDFRFVRSMKRAIVHSDQQRKHVTSGGAQQSRRNRLVRRAHPQSLMRQGGLYRRGAAGNPQAQQRVKEKRLLLTQAAVIGVRIGVPHGFNGIARCIDRFLHSKKFAGTNAACRAATVCSRVNYKMRSMNTTPDLSRLAGTVGDARRVQMLALLMEGRALTAKELALGSGIGPATATAHLRRLLEDGLVVSTAQGRHKYFRLADHQVAQLVESLMRVAERRPTQLARPAAPEPIREARFCYDHLAGSLGTALLALMRRKGWLLATPTESLPKALTLSPKGDRALNDMGISIPEVRSRRRQFACTCLDWSERRDHLGGALGAALAEHFTDAGWIARKKHTRVVSITAEGSAQFARLGIKLPAAVA